MDAQCISALSSGFPILQGNAEAFDRCISNTSAKNYRNRIVCVKIIASQRWDVFLRHSVFYCRQSNQQRHVVHVAKRCNVQGVRYPQ